MLQDCTCAEVILSYYFIRARYEYNDFFPQLSENLVNESINLEHRDIEVLAVFGCWEAFYLYLVFQDGDSCKLGLGAIKSLKLPRFME